MSKAKIFVDIVEAEKGMKLGKVSFSIFYTVDINNKKMVENAKEALLDALSDENVYDHIEVKADPKQKVEDIPDFLREDD